MRSFLFVATIFLIPAACLSADYPLASCSSWNATLIERSGANTRMAIIKGLTTKPDFVEYCLRDPGGETVDHGGKLSVDQCVDKYMRSNGNQFYSATADCDAARITSTVADKVVKMKFPVGGNFDTSCAGGYPPIEAQFILLCPKKAEELDLVK